MTDPDPHVRRAAAANPLLPLDLVGSLVDARESAGPESVEGAAANPALSAERLHALLDRSGVPSGRQ
ncbi:hypothetical protein [Streptomyces novaecaesareae]|uniref:hypothetical protein n=1 Tax=Streptomyces novaecaesareae TaxID=68244 RepID=UPI0004ABC8D2|nr:hypothetical protein [Streptomyces novaecaesareae]